MSMNPKCVDCGAAIFKKGVGRPRLRCDGCHLLKIGRAPACPLTRSPRRPAFEAGVGLLDPPGSFVRCVMCLKQMTGDKSVRCCSQRCSRRAWRCGRRGSCAACGAEIPRNRSKYCRDECRPGNQAQGLTDVCGSCGATFQRTRQRLGSCSVECAAQLKLERQRRKNRKRRFARKGKIAGEYTVAEIALRDGGRCHLCGKKVDMRLDGNDQRGPTIDHLLPVSQGGDDVRENVALAHRDCNILRGIGGEVQLRLVG